MSKKQVFIDYVAQLFDESHDDIPEDAWDYWKALLAEKSIEKPQFTDNGKVILKFLKDNVQIETWKSKDIAEGIGISSRGVSASARKLVNDGYIDKVGQDPVFYVLTEKGKEVIFED